MAKKNKTNGTITLDFTNVYAKYNELMNTPMEGTMVIPVEKKSIWKKIKTAFKGIFHKN